MRAAIMRDGALVVDEVDDPTPGPGQVLVATRACGICGSDLHALHHGEQLVEMTEEAGASLGNGVPVPEVMDLTHDVIMGHEFAAEVIELGENVGNCKPGDLVVSMPMVMDAGGLHPIGYSNHYPGGYGELMVLNDLLARHVPNGLDAGRAALTEPMAVGLHAVNLTGISPGDSALVLGCGPIGLAVVAALDRLGIEPIVAADFSAARRELARVMGADEAIDPGREPAVEGWRRVDGRKPLVIFEAVGVPGMIDQAMTQAPRHSRIMVVGVCMGSDHIRPMLGIGKELTLQFALGYEPPEFDESLRRIAEGVVAVAPLITDRVGVDGVPAAFDALADPDRHAKILVEP